MRLQSASITRAEPRSGECGRPFMSYLVEVHAEHESRSWHWTVHRRYAEFDGLCKELQKRFKKTTSYFPFVSTANQLCGEDEGPPAAVAVPKLPGKKWFGNHMDTDFVLKRAEALNGWLGQVVQDPEIIKSSELLRFFRVDTQEKLLKDRASREEVSVAKKTESVAAVVAKEDLQYPAAEDEEEECAMCCEEFDKENPPMQTECNHQFHLHCIMDWMERNENADCPMCRAKLSFADEEVRKEFEFDEEVARRLSTSRLSQDEDLARRLQEEEMSGGGSARRHRRRRRREEHSPGNARSVISL